ncbi:NAC domain-containing protein 74-like [Pyrus ussuriensis x Pyrus communis]|uniref:NAC domain-containing protein 74-like n=1 Tax=Pyrus ussuriensis x Pyrus communis TaxID=2448454 RepID=A0A5N5F4L2_9ROSA|nr:NAC domain-containing protein 20 isoform X2 [Pyrus x bretschneideri]XP_048421988.1 NAC domain-containing protein 20 isoform X2 [Pyrus x bretschneideri]KAB2597936.1 NAC domain-containing protein 74-like [Pyrus ussuriensis x Pyrus communis]
MSSSSISSCMTTEGDAVHVNGILLPGFRFYPTDELLISYYLKNKIQGTDSHFRHVIPEIDVCKYEPCDLPAFFPQDHEKEWFFFSRPDYKYINSTRCNRATDQGFYKITGKEREIRAEESKAVIGKKRILTFYEGRVPKAKKTDWVVHEYYLTEIEVGSKPTKQMDFVLCRLKNNSASYKKPKGYPIWGELADSGANSEDDQAVVSDVLTEPVQHLGEKELEISQVSLSFDDGDDETGVWKFSDFDDPAMFLELCAEMGEILNSPSQPLQQTPQPHQPPHPHQPSQPHQPQDYCPPTLQAPLHALPGNVSYVYGDCTRRQSLIPDNTSYLEYKNNISTCDPNEQVSKLNGDHDRATEEMFLEAFFQPHECMGPLFDPLQDYLLLSPMNTELGDGVHPNNYIGCNDELRSPDDMEI